MNLVLTAGQIAWLRQVAANETRDLRSSGYVSASDIVRLLIELGKAIEGEGIKVWDLNDRTVMDKVRLKLRRG